MSILDGIVNSSNRAAEGYFRNVQAADEREANAFNRRRIEESDQYARENMMTERTQQNEQIKMKRFSDAAQIAVTNPDAAMQYLAQSGEQPAPEVREMLIAYGQAAAGGRNKVFQPERIINEDGTESLVMPSETGEAVPVGLPQGSRLAPQVTYVDAGNARIPVTRTGVNPGLPAIPIAPSPEQMPEFRAGVRTAETIAGEQTPGGQADLEAQRLANQQAAQKAAEATRKVELAQQAKQEMAELVKEIAGMDISPVYGSMQGGMYSLRSGTVDAESAITRLGRMLTVDNLAKMSGVLTDTDVRILSEAATELQNFRISDERANKEVRRIARVFGIDLGESQANPVDDLVNKYAPD